MGSEDVYKRQQPWRQVNVGAAQGPSAGEIPIDQSAECLRADLSLPGSFWIVHGSRIPRFRVSPNVYRCWIAVAHVFEFWRRCTADSAREWASSGTYSNGGLP